jgi:hypothetical protein
LVHKDKLSDRFIPINKGTNLLEKFELTKTVDNNLLMEIDSNISETEKKHKEIIAEKNSIYTNLLENNFFDSSNFSNINRNLNNNTEDSLLKNFGQQNMEIDGCLNSRNIKSNIFQYKNEK